MAEIALALVLVSAAGLMVRSFLHLANVNTGFHAENVLTVHMLLLPSEDDQHLARVVREMLDRVRHLPGVAAAGSIGILPMEGTNSGTNYYRADRPDPLPSERPEGDVSIITPGYFEAMRIPMVRGRGFEDDDRAGHPLVAILNQSAARMLFSKEDAVGKRVKIEWAKTDVVTVVGVVADIRHEAVNSSPGPCIFMPNEQQPFPFTSLVVRTTGDPALLEQAVRQQIKVIDPDQGIAKVELMRQMVSDSIARPRLEAQVLSIFGVIALGLASLGLYGLIAFSVTQRSREIGIRVALGASKTTILRMILVDGLRLAILGVLFGLVGFAGLTQFLRTLLFEVRPADPATLLSVTSTLLVVSLLASLVPAQRAAKADPAGILRDE